MVELHTEAVTTCINLRLTAKLKTFHVSTV